jgi:hypothetical protein
MAFWNKRARPDSPAPIEQAVLIHVPSLVEGIGLDQIEEPIMRAASDSGAGEFDGNDIGPDGALLYLYGPAADVLWQAIEPAVRRDLLGPGSYAVKRYGAPGAERVRVDLT